MNKEIKRIFDGFTVDGTPVPVKWQKYVGSGEPYILFQNTHYSDPLEADDSFLGAFAHYDFDIYSTGNYLRIAEEMTDLLEDNGWIFCATLCGPDLYDAETGYYHKTFAFKKQYMR